MPYKIPIFLDRLSTIYSWSKFIKNQDFKMLHLINVKKFKIEIGIEGIFVMTSKWLASFGINKPKRNVMSCYWDSHIFECWGNSRLLHFVAFFHVASLILYRVDNRKVGVDNKKALELTNSTVFHRSRQWKSSRAGQQNIFFIFQPGFNVELSTKNGTKNHVYIDMIEPKMFLADFIFRQQENQVDNQKCQAGFRPLCNKVLSFG